VNENVNKINFKLFRKNKDLNASKEYKKNKYNKSFEISNNSRSQISTNLSFSNQKLRYFTVKCPYCLSYIYKVNGNNLISCKSNKCKDSPNTFCFLCKTNLTSSFFFFFFTFFTIINICISLYFLFEFFLLYNKIYIF